MLQDTRVRIAWLSGLVRVAVIAMNRDLDFGTLETVRIRIMGMEDEVHWNEEEIVDSGFVKCVGLVVAVLKSIYMGRDVRFPR